MAASDLPHSHTTTSRTTRGRTVGELRLRAASGGEIRGSGRDEGSGRSPVEQTGLPGEIAMGVRKPWVGIGVVMGVRVEVLIGGRRGRREEGVGK